jgi:hypothetical protein
MFKSILIFMMYKNRLSLECTFIINLYEDTNINTILYYILLVKLKKEKIDICSPEHLDGVD